jgi:hypothetical protein
MMLGSLVGLVMLAGCAAPGLDRDSAQPEAVALGP